MKRYQVVTYSWGAGADDKMDFSRLSDAVKNAKAYQAYEEYAAVYDRIKKTAYVVFGDLSESVFADFVTVKVF